MRNPEESEIRTPKPETKAHAKDAKDATEVDRRLRR